MAAHSVPAGLPLIVASACCFGFLLCPLPLASCRIFHRLAEIGASEVGGGEVIAEAGPVWEGSSHLFGCLGDPKPLLTATLQMGFGDAFGRQRAETGPQADSHPNRFAPNIAITNFLFAAGSVDLPQCFSSIIDRIQSALCKFSRNRHREG